MSSHPAGAPRLLLLWVRAVSLVVPTAVRDQWLEEWAGELCHGIDRERHRARRLLGFASGALWDALAIRFPERGDRTEHGRRLAGFGIPQAVRLAYRSLRAAPGSTTAAILTLGLGIGGAVSIFAVVDAVLVRPLPYTQAERLVNLWDPSGAPGADETTGLPLSPPHVAAILNGTDVFEQIALSQAGQWVLSQAGAPATLNALRVNASFLRLLGVQPALGRLLTADDDRGGAPVVAILTHALWRDEFGSDPEIIGKTISVNYSGRAPIVGVLPRGFVLDYAVIGREDLRGVTVDAYFSRPLPQVDDPRAWNARVFHAVGLLREGIGLAQAQAAVDGLEAEMTAARTDALGDRGPVRTALVPVLDQLVSQARPALLLLLAAVGLLLLLACANCAILLLGRGSLRGREVALHVALGARRGHVIIRFLAEASMIAGASAAVGLGLASLAVWAVHTFGPAVQLPRVAEIAVDRRVFAAAAILALLSALASGLIPSLRLSRVTLNVLLKDTGRRPLGAGLRRRFDLASTLVAAEIALSVTLLIGTALLVRSVMTVSGIEPGFDRDHTLSFRLHIPYEPYRRGEPPYLALTALKRQIRTRLSALPGIEGVAGLSDVPFDFQGSPNQIRLVGAGSDAQVPAALEYADRNAFEVLGIPVTEGRGFVDEDFVPGVATVAIVNETFAGLLGGARRALGRSLHPTGWDAPLDIVGVVADVRDGSLVQSPERKVYVAMTDGVPAPTGYWAVRASAGASGTAERIRNAIQSIDPDILVSDLQTTEQRLRATLSVHRASAWLLQVFVALGAILAVVGVHAVVSDRVGQARHEIGVRMAVGASSADVVRMVLRYSAVLAAVGTLAGVVLAAGLARFIGGVLYGVDPLDPATYVASAVLLVMIALAAAFVPARSAGRADPVATLRQMP